MAINSLKRRENSMLDVMLTPDSVISDVLDRYAMIGQYYPIPPTDAQVFGGAPRARPMTSSPASRARAKVVTD